MAGVSVSVVIVDILGNLGYDSIYSGFVYFCWDGSSLCAFWYDSMAHSCTLHLYRRLW